MEYIIRTKSGKEFWIEYKGDMLTVFNYIKHVKSKDEWLKCLIIYGSFNRKTLLDPMEIESIEQMNKDEYSLVKRKRVED